VAKGAFAAMLPLRPEHLGLRSGWAQAPRYGHMKETRGDPSAGSGQASRAPRAFAAPRRTSMPFAKPYLDSYH